MTSVSVAIHILFKKNLKMTKQRYVKQVFVTLLLIGLVMVTLQVLKTLEQEVSSDKGKYSEYYAGNVDSESGNTAANDFKSGELRDEFPFPRSKAATISLQKPSTNAKCGYDYCPKTQKDVINIHLVPHSHHDPGYKKTMNEYFYGLRNDIQNVNIYKILDNVIHELTLNKDRKFIYAEVVYFRKWWHLQTESTRETVRDLIQSGRFEFINGGWCVHDEANTNYADIIDQMSLGLNFLVETFGECGRPKVAFQADTFGHSREQALLSSLMGFDALFVGRVDEGERQSRIKALEMEMIWSGSDLPGKHPSIFTGITYNVFDPPTGFCFDNICGVNTTNESINDDENSKSYNVEKQVDQFLDYCKIQAKAYKTTNIVVYMGSDYTYENASVWFVNMDKLIKYINKRQGSGGLFNIFYSTPACYVKELNEANVTWPTKNDDFFPYRGIFPFYWSGYFSSRPALKYMVRQGSSLLQACKQMASVLQLKSAEDQGDLSVMKEAMALLQHHDGITGTHSQRVNEDYVRILHRGFEECTKTMNSYYQAEMPKNDEEMKKCPFKVSYCQELNISKCEVTDRKGESFVVNVYNSLGQYIDKYIRVPVTQKNNGIFYNFRVIDSNGKLLPSQLMPIPSFVATIPGRNSSADHELVFLATNLPPIGSKSYYIEVSVSRKTKNPLILIPFWNSSNPRNGISDLTISNEKVTLVLCKETGSIASVNILGMKPIPLDQQFYWYNGNGGNCTFTFDGSSGVYAFNPQKDSALRVKIGTKNVTVYKGDLVEEIHQTINDYVSQIIRIYRGHDYIEFDWVVGPIPIKDGIGKEIITRYSTDFENNGEFYTDANGRQSIKRTRDKMNIFDENDPVASNYYPITSHIFMNDSKSGYRMNVLTDRAQGGGSIQDGQLELMIHRRFVQQDYCIFKEPLDEIAHGEGLVVSGKHTLFFENTQPDGNNNNSVSSTLRSLVRERSREPQMSFISLNYTSKQWIRSFRSKLQLLTRPLPENVKLLTFEPRSGHKGEYILRLEHIYDFGEHPVLSSPAEVSLKGLFKNFYIEEIEETMLDGNLKKSDLLRLSWKSTNDNDVNANLKIDYNNSPKTMERIKLMPMEIRTFVIRLLE